MVAAHALAGFPYRLGDEVNKPPGRILAVDPGLKRIGLAVSDPTCTIASPLRVIPHIARMVDAAQIAQIAAELRAEKIIIGCPLDSEGLPGPAARSAARLAEAVRSQTDIQVELWDESGSTRTARQTRVEMGVPRRQRSGHVDEAAAALILQTYLDAHLAETPGSSHSHPD